MDAYSYARMPAPDLEGSVESHSWSTNGYFPGDTVPIPGMSMMLDLSINWSPQLPDRRSLTRGPREMYQLDPVVSGGCLPGALGT